MANFRINIIFFIFIGFSLLIFFRLFFWQIIKAEELSEAAKNQYFISFDIPAKRGQILSSDGFPLATNDESFLLYATLPNLKEKPSQIAEKLASLIATDSASIFRERLERDDLVWVPLRHKLDRNLKQQVETLAIEGLGFEEEQKRSYPESSSAAHLLGFVGSDRFGNEKGYFGLEGFYDLELKGHPGVYQWEKDASGKPILVGERQEEAASDGRTLVTTIDRSVQYIIEENLKKGLKRFGAINGSIVVMDPYTGAILGMVSEPSYDPGNFASYESNLYSNPVISGAYEPGSTFKVLVMAAAINEGVVTPETRCASCGGPKKVADYTIKTWNEEYYPEETMTEVIQHSDNVGMVFVAEKLGLEKMLKYLKEYGFGESTEIDLEDESVPKLRPDKEWRSIDLATVSFGQGVAVTALQMVRAVGTIANGGKLVKPYIVKKVVGDKVDEIKPTVIRQVLKPTTTKSLREMMVNAVEKGEAKWAKPKGFSIAGKTGTAQIPVAGHYDEDKTIASFVGFAPAENPKFVMLVTLREPASSPWGSETAAPLWFDIARELFAYYGSPTSN